MCKTRRYQDGAHLYAVFIYASRVWLGPRALLSEKKMVEAQNIFRTWQNVALALGAIHLVKNDATLIDQGGLQLQSILLRQRWPNI